jgi:F0F1-type ATP synthase membrane subunit b/b'
MPQLDFISFFSQIFWLCLVFVFFYLFVFKNLVPFVSRIIKVRNKNFNYN